MIERRTHDRASVGELLAAMAAWPHADRPVRDMHPGDLGWHLRLNDPAVSEAFHGWWHDGSLVAVGLLEGSVGRFAVAPGHELDRDLGEQLATACRELPGDEAYADVAAETAVRHLLVGEGWSLDPDPWFALHAELARWSPATDLAGVDVREAAECIHERVSVQRAGFENSTFTEDAWHRMAAGPGYRRELDLVVFEPGGAAVAVATAWWVGAGATAILEPVATHRDHRGQGWGLRAVTAAVSRLRELGASGVSACTPVSYVGAAATYRAAGLRTIEQLPSLVRQPTA